MKQVPLPGTWQRDFHTGGNRGRMPQTKLSLGAAPEFLGNLERQFLCDGGCFRLKGLKQVLQLRENLRWNAYYI
jgi:hypothetical protein